MAFQFTKVVYLPSSLKGVYLLPLAWLRFGLEQDYITIESKKFWDSLQGNVYAEYLSVFEQGKAFSVTEDGQFISLVDENSPDNFSETMQMFLYEGQGEIFAIQPDFQYKLEDQYFYGKDNYAMYDPDLYKMGIYLATLEYMEKSTPVTQKTINNGYIQLFHGSHLRLKQSVWF